MPSTVHVTVTNHFMCTGEIFWKSLSQRQNLFAAKIKCLILCDLLWRQRFSQYLSSTHEAISLSDVSPQRVAETCCLTCIDP